MDVQAHIRALCEQIVDGFRPNKVILFGSYANGSPTTDSDIDLLVVMRFKGRGHNQAVKIRRILKGGMPLDLLVRTPEQLAERIEMGDFFMRSIIDYGKVLYEAADA